MFLTDKQRNLAETIAVFDTQQLEYFHNKHIFLLL